MKIEKVEFVGTQCIVSAGGMPLGIVRTTVTTELLNSEEEGYN